MLTLAFRIDSFDFEFFPCIGEIKVWKMNAAEPASLETKKRFWLAVDCVCLT